MKKRILLSELPSRYTVVDYRNFCKLSFLMDSICKLLDSSSALSIIMTGVQKKKITVLFDEYKYSYIVLVPKKSCYFLITSFHRVIVEKFHSDSLFPSHYSYTFNAF